MEELDMKNKPFRLSSLMLVVAVFAVLLFQYFTIQALAADENIKKMAQIMLRLNHYPNDSEKQTLKEITLSSASSNYEKTVANAMINLQHQATAEDKQKLNSIMNDKSAPEDIRTLATIVHNVNHHPSDQDKEKLKKLM
jgi:predicted nucleotidyltransferase